MENLNTDMSSSLEQARQDYQSGGLAVIPNFLDEKTVAELVAWTDQNDNLVFHQRVEGNAYLNKGEPELGEDHVLNKNEGTALGVIALDQIPAENPLRAIYNQPLLKDLITYITGKEQVYQYECPLGGINISVMKESDYLRWHFDQSDFVVSIPLRYSDEGGLYQYVHNLKSKEDPSYAAVEKVLDGEHSKVQILDAVPGSLVLFQGMHTLHRVTQIKGPTSRIVALLGFVDEPGVTSTDYLKEIRYGRTK